MEEAEVSWRAIWKFSRGIPSLRWTMPSVRPINAEYRDKAKTVLRSMLTEAGKDYESLAAKLRAMGIWMSARRLENKISWGEYSTAFLPQCMDAIERPLFDAN